MNLYINKSSVYSKKSWNLLFLLSFFFGIFAADLFYLERYYLAFFKLVTFSGFGIWWLIDLILVIFQKQKDFEGKEVVR